MRSLLHAASTGRSAPIHIVCLPGAYHGPEDFVTAGFDTQVRRRRLPIDLHFVDLEMRHLGDRDALGRLHRDLLGPLRQDGSRALWLAGISLGGFIALDHLARHPQSVDGVCVLAPYLGNRMLIAELGRAPDGEASAAVESDGDDEERQLWRHLRTRSPDSPPVHLGFGSEDRFVTAHRLMARTLPDGRIDVVTGGHDWRTWTLLWEHFLDANFA